jgi:Protein of unknown function (DUF3300)
VQFALRRAGKRAIATLSVLLILSLGSLLLAQEPPYNGPDTSSEQGQPLLSPSELNNLVAPIALYPDALLSQVLVVSTYPQELEEAEQWLQQNGNLEGAELMDAAKQQNWDPSVQALVAFPSVMALLTGDMQWTAALGQAFLAQPTDVMNAIQNLRAQARNNGQLVNTPQLEVNTEFQNGQSAIEIQPVNPQVMYVPAYNPYAVWGPPVAGAYPGLAYAGSTFASLIGSAINLASLFAGFPGLLGPSGWGWGLSWLARALFVNNSFLSNFGFRNNGGGRGGSTIWVHNGGFRTGAAYAGDGGGWRMFGHGSQMSSGGRSGTAFAPQRSAGGGFQAHNWAGSSGNWQRFDRVQPRAPTEFARPSWSGNRERQASNGPASKSYAARSENYTRSANYRAPFTHWGSGAPGDGGFSNSYDDRARSAFRAPEQSGRSWGHPFRSSQPRMDSGPSFWQGRSSAPSRSFKPPHMPKEHFSAPHFKSHESSHASHGHSGGKHRW